MNNVFNRYKEALDQYLASKKASDLKSAIRNAFGYEVKGQSNHKISQFLSKQGSAAFAAFSSFPAMLAASVTQTLQHMGEITLDHIKALSLQYDKSHAPAPIDSVNISKEFASAQVKNAVDFQIDYQLEDVARVQDGSFIGPLRSEMADLKTAFDAGKMNTDDFQREALYLRGVVFSQKYNKYAVSNTTINQLRSVFDGGYGRSPVIIFKDAAQQIYSSPSHQQIGAPAPVYA